MLQLGRLLEKVDQSLLVPEEEEEEWDQLNREVEDRGAEEPLRNLDRSTEGKLPGDNDASPLKLGGEESLQRHKSVLDQLEETFGEVINGGNGSSLAKKDGVRPPEEKSGEVPDSDEDLFGDDSQRDTEDQNEVQKEDEDHHHHEDDVWEDFDCDAGGDIFMDDQASQQSEELEVSFVAHHEDGSKTRQDADRQDFQSSTPEKTRKKGRKPLTPTPKYEKMLTPELRNELKRFGLKVIPRRKAEPLLSHIHRETRKRRRLLMEKEESQSQSSSQQSGCTEEEDECDREADVSVNLAEESIFADVFKEDEEEVPVSTQQAKARPVQGEELSLLLKDFLVKDKNVHTQVLMYEPLWLEDLFASFKSELNVKCKLAEFMDALDAECVTFRTRASASRRRRNQEKPGEKRKKARSPPKKRRAMATQE